MSGSPRQVWFVDDNRAAHEMFRIAFSGLDAGISVRGFFSAEEVVGALIGGETPNLILLDINMPGLGGFHLLKERARNNIGYVPVMILSTSANPDDIRAAYSHGANAYVEKPPDLESLESFARAVSAFWFDLAILPPSSPAARALLPVSQKPTRG